MSVQLHEASIRPAAVLPIEAATRIVAALEKLDVSRGGVWNASTSVWQRYDRPWDGPAGSRGSCAAPTPAPKGVPQLAQGLGQGRTNRDSRSGFGASICLLGAGRAQIRAKP